MTQHVPGTSSDVDGIDDAEPLAPFDANRPGSLLEAIEPTTIGHSEREPYSDDDSQSTAQKRSPPPDEANKRKLAAWMIAALLIGLTITVLSVLGSLHAKQWSLHCTATEMVAQRGRAFPPWGMLSVADPDLRAIQIDADSECNPRQANDRQQLEDWFVTALSEQATLRLARRKGDDVDTSFAQLQQALLLTRTAERRDTRKEIERLLGDVDYWRASARLQTTTDELLQAAAQFDAAAQKRPRHVTDASSWAGHVRRLVERLRAGPEMERTSERLGAGPNIERASGPAQVRQTEKDPADDQPSASSPSNSSQTASPRVGEQGSSNVPIQPSPPTPLVPGVLL
jgi:hypothetical protein